jgi:hypothetical protein
MSTQIRPIRLSTIDTYRASQYVNPSANTKFQINSITKKKLKPVKKEVKIDITPREHIIGSEPVTEPIVSKTETVEKEINYKNYNTYQKLILATLRKKL